MEKITLGEENIESIGLVLEPNFFRIHCYSDLDGTAFVKTVSCKRDRDYNFGELQAKNHLFALSSQPHWTIVPASIFREEDMAVYLELNTGFKTDSIPAYSFLEGLDSVLIYERDQEADILVSLIQPALEIKHIEGALLEYGRQKVYKNKGDLLQIQILDDLAIINIFKDGSLLLANNIEVAKTEDLIYYMFYALKKLEISTDIHAELDGFGNFLSSASTQAGKFLKNLKVIEKNHLAEIIAQCV